MAGIPADGHALAGSILAGGALDLMLWLGAGLSKKETMSERDDMQFGQSGGWGHPAAPKQYTCLNCIHYMHKRREKRERQTVQTIQM
jgi:hypothetical protein